MKTIFFILAILVCSCGGQGDDCKKANDTYLTGINEYCASNWECHFCWCWNTDAADEPTSGCQAWDLDVFGCQGTPGDDYKTCLDRPSICRHQGASFAFEECE